MPTWVQIGSQLEAKIHSKSIQEPSKSHPNYHLVLDPFLDRFRMDFGSIFELKPPPNQPKTNQNSNQARQQPKNKKVCFVLASPVELCCRACGVLSKNSENRSNSLQRAVLKALLQVILILGPTGFHFGRVLASIWIDR